MMFNTPVTRIIHLLKGEYLFHQGDEVKFLYKIQTGRIRLQRFTMDGKESVMYEGVANESFAEASLFSNHYHCDAIVMQKSTIEAYVKQELLMEIQSNPAGNQAYMAQLARQIQRLRTDLELRNINSAHERIYHFLILNADDTGKVTLDSSLKDLARQLGLAHETLYRALARLEKDQRILRDAKGGIFIFVL